MKQTLTQKAAERAKPKAQPYQIHDTTTPGLALRVQPSGYKSWKLVIERGKTLTLGRFPTLTFQMAREKAAAIQRGEEAQPKRRKKMTFATFLKEHYKPYVRANHSRPSETLACLGRFELGDKLLDAITLADVETWRLRRQQDGTSPKTINRDTATLKAALNKAVKWELLDNNPLTGLDPLKIDRSPRVRYLSDKEQKRLVKALIRSESDVLEPMVLLALNTGMRRGELWALRWGDVDLRRKMLTVEGAGAKSGQTRHIPLNKVAVATLKAHKGGVAPMPDNVVFGRVEIKKSWATALKKAKIAGFRFHDLRHTFASRLVMAGVPLNTVRELLGHQSIEMVLRYAHLAPENLRAAVDKL